MYDALIDSQSTSVKSFCQDQRDLSTLMEMEKDILQRAVKQSNRCIQNKT